MSGRVPEASMMVCPKLVYSQVASTPAFEFMSRATMRPYRPVNVRAWLAKKHHGLPESFEKKEKKTHPRLQRK